jgi:drug/metabolite transporter (DMT)-like permease
MFEASIVFAFLAMISWGFGDFFIQRTTRKVGDLEALAFIGIIGSLGLLPFVLNDIALLFYTSNILLLLFLGFTTFVIGVVDFEALKKGKLCVIDMILEIELPVTIVFSFLFFKETLSLFQTIVISLIFIGIVLIATKCLNRKHFRLEKGVLIALMAAIGMGLINFLTAASSKTISPIMAVWFPWVIFTILSLAIIAKRERMPKLISNFKKFKTLVLAMGIFDTLAWLFYALAVFKNEVSITTAITEAYPAIAILLGAIENREKINWHQYLGAALAIIASFALAMSL